MTIGIETFVKVRSASSQHDLSFWGMSTCKIEPIDPSLKSQRHFSSPERLLRARNAELAIEFPCDQVSFTLRQHVERQRPDLHVPRCGAEPLAAFQRSLTLADTTSIAESSITSQSQSHSHSVFANRGDRRTAGAMRCAVTRNVTYVSADASCGSFNAGYHGTNPN